MKITAKNQNQALEPSASFSQKQYITDLYECEKTKYILEKRDKWLAHQISTLIYIPPFEKTKYYTQYKKDYDEIKHEEFDKVYEPYNHTKEFSEYFWKFVGAGIILSLIFNVIIVFSKNHAVFFYGIIKGLEIDFFSAILGVIISPLIILIKNSLFKRKKSKYKIEFEKASKIVAERATSIQNKRMNEYTNRMKQISQENAPILDMYRKEQDEVLKNLKRVKETLKELYSMRINGILCLHPNYQGLMPISILYGYFDTGRCTQLQGHEGAYNLYEDEKMKGMIINKLDYVSKQLNKMNSTMSYVASAIDSCNNRLSTLEESGRRMEKSIGNLNENVNSLNSNVSNQMTAIEANTANAAYYSEVSARCDAFNTVYNLYDN